MRKLMSNDIVLKEDDTYGKGASATISASGVQSHIRTDSAPSLLSCVHVQRYIEHNPGLFFIRQKSDSTRIGISADLSVRPEC